MNAEVINYSEFATLAICEMRWFYGFRAGQVEDRSQARGLHRGTLIHVWGDRWLRGLGATLPESWTDDINTGGKPGEVRTVHLSDFDPSDVALASWLAERYEAYYGSQPHSSWNVISAEEWMQVQLADGTVVVGRTDGLIEIEGELWLREMKSYGSKSRLDTIGVEPQPSIYYALVEANYGRPLMGILYDGIYTYQWKPEKPTLAVIEAGMIEAGNVAWTKKDLRLAAKQIQAQHPGVQRPPEESFRREWPDRSDEQVQIAMRHLQAAIARRTQIQVREDAIPNVGTSCRSCGFKPRCWAELQGLDGDVMIEEEDDDQELEWNDD